MPFDRTHFSIVDMAAIAVIIASVIVVAGVLYSLWATS
jgi:hypothetical protein